MIFPHILKKNDFVGSVHAKYRTPLHIMIKHQNSFASFFNVLYLCHVGGQDCSLIWWVEVPVVLAEDFAILLTLVSRQFQAYQPHLSDNYILANSANSMFELKTVLAMFKHGFIYSAVCQCANQLWVVFLGGASCWGAATVYRNCVTIWLAQEI